MPLRGPEPALRRLVSRLAGLHADDLAAILTELDGGQRRTVEKLLEEHALVFGDLKPVAAAEPDAFDTAHLSPWLAQRVRSDGALLTEATRKVLRELAQARHTKSERPIPLSGKGAP
jgi:hypothetical protein